MRIFHLIGGRSETRTLITREGRRFSRPEPYQFDEPSFFGGLGWGRTNNVYPEGPDLQSGDAHAIASTNP